MLTSDHRKQSKEWCTECSEVDLTIKSQSKFHTGKNLYPHTCNNQFLWYSLVLLKQVSPHIKLLQSISLLAWILNSNDMERGKNVKTSFKSDCRETPSYNPRKRVWDCLSSLKRIQRSSANNLIFNKIFKSPCVMRNGFESEFKLLVLYHDIIAVLQDALWFPIFRNKTCVLFSKMSVKDHILHCI